MSQKRSITEADLSAYLDRAMDAQRRREIDEEIRNDPDLAAKVEAYRHQCDSLHRLYDPVLDAPIPERLQKILESK